MKITDEQNSYVKLNGVYGKFKSPGKKVWINYFLTTANSREDQTLPYSQLLREMKPLRDRIKISEINTLSDLLQRDINDKRVAQKIIPYLVNESGFDPTLPTFFPSVLVVLIPKESFSQGTNSDSFYPSITEYEDTTQYGNHWSLTRIKDSSNEKKYTNIASLKVNFHNTFPIVIDGQHRSAAFRFINDCVDFDERGSIYSKFYENINESQRLLDSDLPVTILWVDVADRDLYIESVNIKEIARKLFVDINQSPEYISQSRLILLNDMRPNSFITRKFYSFLVSEKGYALDKLSLAHSGFDYPYDVSDNKGYNGLTLFVPEQISYCLNWLLFSSNNYRRLDLKNDIRERKSQQSNYTVFDNYLGGDFSSRVITTYKDLDGNEEVRILASQDTSSFSLALDRFCESLYFILSANGYSKNIVKAIDTLNAHIQSESEEITQHLYEAWTKLYLGGEGLYYIFLDHKNEKTKGYIKACTTIENMIETGISKEIGISELQNFPNRKTVTSTAHLVGYMMSFDYYFSCSNRTLEEASRSFVEIMNKIDWIQFSLLLVRMKGFYLKELKPKTWPRFRNIYLRFIQACTEEMLLTTDHLLEREIRDLYFFHKIEQYCNDNPELDFKEIKKEPDTYLHQDIVTNFKDTAKSHIDFLFEGITQIKLNL